MQIKVTDKFLFPVPFYKKPFDPIRWFTYTSFSVLNCRILIQMQIKVTDKFLFPVKYSDEYFKMGNINIEYTK